MGRGVTTGPHTPAQINAFCIAAGGPNDFGVLQNAAAAVFSASRIQYLQTVPMRVGGAPADGANPTSYLIRGEDVFVQATGGGLSFLEIRPSSQIAQNLITITLGTKTGDRTTNNLGGINGGTLFLNGNQTFTCNMGVYGSVIVARGQLNWNNLNPDLQEIGGSIFIHTSTNPVYNLGLVDNGKFYFQNSIATTTRVASPGAMFSGMVAQDLTGSIACMGTGNLDWFVNLSTGRSTRFPKFSGQPTIGDLKYALSGFVVEPIWSGGSLRVFSAGTPADQGCPEFWRFDTKVVDIYGNPVADVPVYLESDVTGPHASALTLADGNIVFTNPASGVNNAVQVRDWWGGDNLTNTGVQARDRLFTLTVNGYADYPAFTPNPNYMTQKFRFEWPGRDQSPSGYAVDGGMFKKVVMPIRLLPGRPSRDPLWDECEVA